MPLHHFSHHSPLWPEHRKPHQRDSGPMRFTLGPTSARARVRRRSLALRLPADACPSEHMRSGTTWMPLRRRTHTHSHVYATALSTAGAAASAHRPYANRMLARSPSTASYVFRFVLGRIYERVFEVNASLCVLFLPVYRVCRPVSAHFSRRTVSIARQPRHISQRIVVCASHSCDVCGVLCRINIGI